MGAPGRAERPADPRPARVSAAEDTRRRAGRILGPRAPTEGYTYVRPFRPGGTEAAETDDQAPREVIPMGLHILALELPAMGQEIADAEDVPAEPGETAE